jgi:hypothetical protein
VEKKMVLDAIYGISQAWSSMNPLVQLWRKLLPDLEKDDLQVFLNEEIGESEILDMCAMRCFENVDEDNEVWLQSDAYELGFQHMTDRDIVNTAAKQMGEEEGGEDESEEGQKD